MTCFAKLLFTFLILSMLVACSRPPAPDYYTPGTRVTVTIGAQGPFILGPKSSQLFLDMLTNQPVHSEIGQMPATPLGEFTVGTNKYLWHGNAVIRGEGRKERLWYGPYLQKLVNEVLPIFSGDRDPIQHVLEALEQDSSVASTPLQGPGQYPGGANDALHPTKITTGDTNGFQVFIPETNKP